MAFGRAPCYAVYVVARWLWIGMPLAVALAGCDSLAGRPSPASLTSEDEKTLYALGVAMGRSVRSFNLTPTELEAVKQGLTDSVAGHPSNVPLEIYGPKLEELAKTRAASFAQKEKAAGESYLREATREPGAATFPSGLVLRTLRPGTGPRPTPADRVKVLYEGTFTDGAVFDSARVGDPVELTLGSSIPCWVEGVQKMRVGERARLVCPPRLAYGDDGRPPVMPGNATLVFEIDLLGIAGR